MTSDNACIIATFEGSSSEYVRHIYNATLKYTGEGNIFDLISCVLLVNETNDLRLNSILE